MSFQVYPKPKQISVIFIDSTLKFLYDYSYENPGCLQS